MTNVELYDLALRKGVDEPAVFRLGESCIFGCWLNAEEAAKHDASRIMHQTPTRSVYVLAKGATWEECATKVGWFLGEPVTMTRTKTVKT